ncbi:hypothetical protein [Absidia glauca]|uniref:Cytochrome c oxidase subunit 12, mitochondrial n=1 Tax=Absidia glauca TaxID=4829 RepID=A0A168SWT3_ABSGL|nr:hypothetical protein [Absidia glauca]
MNEQLLLMLGNALDRNEHLPTTLKHSSDTHSSLSLSHSSFPNTNQTKHCWQNYVDYFKCIDARGEDFVPCKQFKSNFQSLCPNSWIEKWDTQREAGENPSNFSL